MRGKGHLEAVPAVESLAAVAHFAHLGIAACVVVLEHVVGRLAVLREVVRKPVRSHPRRSARCTMM